MWCKLLPVYDGMAQFISWNMEAWKQTSVEVIWVGKPLRWDGLKVSPTSQSFCSMSVFRSLLMWFHEALYGWVVRRNNQRSLDWSTVLRGSNPRFGLLVHSGLGGLQAFYFQPPEKNPQSRSRAPPSPSAAWTVRLSLPDGSPGLPGAWLRVLLV